MHPYFSGQAALTGRLFADHDLAAMPAGYAVPVLDLARAVPGDDVETPVTTDSMAGHGFAAPGFQRTATRRRPTRRVPFRGSAELFRARPPVLIDPQISAPYAEIDGDELVLTCRGSSEDPAEQQRDLDRQVATIEQLLGYLRDALDAGRPSRTP